MRLLDFDAGRGSDVTRFGAVGLRAVPIARSAGASRFAVTALHLVAGGRVGRHDARLDQVLVVVGGSGWVDDEHGTRTSVRSGQAVAFEAGESHDVGTNEGMTALVIEADELDQP